MNKFLFVFACLCAFQLIYITFQKSDINDLQTVKHSSLYSANMDMSGGIRPQQNREQPQDNHDHTPVNQLARKLQATGEFASMSHQEIQNNINAQFNREAVDEAWAEDRKLNMERMIADNVPLSREVINNIICKSHQCKISVSTNDLDHVNRIEEHLFNALVSHHLYEPTTVLMPMPRQQNGTVEFVITDQALLGGSLTN